MDKNYLSEKVGYFKLLMTILATVDIGVIAWFFQNMDKVKGLKLVLVVI